jgi:L-threonylcarbamoyladenylate synthase
MTTRRLPPDKEALSEAAGLLRAGELVAFPTETVYGLGADALDAQAAAKIYQAKGRPPDNPLIIHIASPEQAESFCHVSRTARTLMDRFFPGPLTLVLPKKTIVPDIVTAGLDSVAFRMPGHPVALRLIKSAGTPIAAPSANRSGKPSPTTAEHVMEDMDGRIPLVIDGGPCRIGVESTVLDIRSQTPLILRPGGVTFAAIREVLGEVQLADGALRPVKSDEPAASPGMRHTHYAPDGTLTLVSGPRGKALETLRMHYDRDIRSGLSAALFAFSEDLPELADRYVLSLGHRNCPEETAGRLFALLRRMDAEAIRRIYSLTTEADGMGLAVMNRLTRAAGYRIIDALEVYG